MTCVSVIHISAFFTARHFVLEYIEDAIAQLLVYKDDAPKVDINRFFAQ